MTEPLRVSQSEQASGRMDPERLASAVAALRENGYLIVEDAVSIESLEKLDRKMMEDWAVFREQGAKWIGGGRIIGHYGAVPPTLPEYLFADILLNDLIYQISEAYLGGEVTNVRYACNTNAPRSKRQSFHSDNYSGVQSFLYVNISLVDTDERNGSMELVPGTETIPFSYHRVNELLKTRPVVRANTRRGSVLFRTPNLWHRGAANPSSGVRHMLGMTHARADTAATTHAPMRFPPEAETFFRSSARKTHAVFDGEGSSSRFLPNYFQTGVVGCMKEILFCIAPELCERAKLMAEAEE